MPLWGVQPTGEQDKTMTKTTWLALAVLTFGCDLDPEYSDIEGAHQEHNDAILETIENLQEAGYPDDEIEVREDGVVIAGGDAEVSLEASREMIGVETRDGERWEPDEDFRQYRTTNLVNASTDLICVNGSAFTGTMSTALNNAIANYNALDLSFDLLRTSGPSAGCDATINAVVMAGTSGLAGFPSGGNPYGTIRIGSGIPTTYGLNATTHVIMHELGHCIGFRHSDYYNRSISCGGGAINEGAGAEGAVHIPGTPATAVHNGSVMNSCYNAGSTGTWTGTDVTALNTLYPPAAPSPVPAAPNPLTKHSEACYGFYEAFWTAQPTATEYQLHRSTSSTFSSPIMVYSGPATQQWINVTSGTWYLRARACNASGCSGWTNQISATRLGYCM